MVDDNAMTVFIVAAKVMVIGNARTCGCVECVY